MKNNIKFLGVGLALLLLQGCGESGDNFLIGAWVIDIDSLPAEMQESAVQEQLATMEISFTEEFLSFPGIPEPIAVNYEIDGDHIIVSPAEENIPEDEYLHYYLIDEEKIRADLSPLGVEQDLILRRVDSE